MLKTFCSDYALIILVILLLVEKHTLLITQSYYSYWKLCYRTSVMRTMNKMLYRAYCREIKSLSVTAQSRQQSVDSHAQWMNGWEPYILDPRLLCRFLHLTAQMTRTHARVCLFGFGWYCSPFMISNCPKTAILGSWIGVFRPNAPNIKTFIL